MGPLAVVPILLLLALQPRAAAFAEPTVPSATVPAAAAAAANDCTSSHSESDLNGDGIADTVIGDPAATVSGLTVSGLRGAGIVQVRYGVGDSAPTGLRTTLAQGSAPVGGTAGADNGFGSAIKVGRVDGDTCADVVIGVPGATVGTAKAAGEVEVIFGSPAGLGLGRSSLVLHPGVAGLPGKPAAGERFGSVLAVHFWASASTEPHFVAVGVPRRDVKGVVDAGAVDYVTFAADGTVQAARTITEASAGVAGTPQTGDHFGYALAPGFFQNGCRGIWCDDLMVGEPGKDKGAGAIVSVTKPGAGSPYTNSKVWSQNTYNVAGTSEPGDGFGSSMSFELDTALDTRRLVVGSPGEDLGNVKDAGDVHLFIPSGNQMTAASSREVSMNSVNVAGKARAGARFGATVLAAHEYLDGLNSTLVVGIPGEDVAGHKEAGAFATFDLRSYDFGLYDHLVTENTAGVPGTATAGEHFGSSLSESGQYHLLVGAPDDTQWNGQGVVLRIPWTTIKKVKVSTPDPGSALTRTGSSRFGAVLAVAAI